MTTTEEIYRFLDSKGVRVQGRKAEVARATGFTPTYVGRVLDGKAPITDRFTRLLISAFGPNPVELPFLIKEAVYAMESMAEPMQYRAVAVLKEMLLNGQEPSQISSKLDQIKIVAKDPDLAGQIFKQNQKRR